MAILTKVASDHHHQSKNESNPSVAMLEFEGQFKPEPAAVAKCFHCKVRNVEVKNLPCQHATVCQGCAYLENTCSICHAVTKADKPLI